MSMSTRQIQIVKDRRKTNELGENASIIAGVAAVRNASREPDVDGPDEVGPVLFRTSRPSLSTRPFSTSDSDFSILLRDLRFSFFLVTLDSVLCHVDALLFYLYLSLLLSP